MLSKKIDMIKRSRQGSLFSDMGLLAGELMKSNSAVRMLRVFFYGGGTEKKIASWDFKDLTTTLVRS